MNQWHLVTLIITGANQKGAITLMEKDIINLQQYTDALRSTGYKNIECAVAEIVDNSFEAEAKNVFIIVKSSISELTNRKCVNEIAFLDNGTGMTKDIVQSCLGIGFGNRQARRGMGRFGVGLPQASLHVCPLVEVYSWQEYNICYKSYLDLQKIKNGDQKSFQEPDICEIPREYIKYLDYNIGNINYQFNQSGTLVVWKNCDNVSPKTVTPLFERLELALGQKFRYWIHDKERSIHLINMENANETKYVLPNDPLFLMDDNLILGNPTKPGEIEKSNRVSFIDSIFEPFINDVIKDGRAIHPIKYIDKNTSSIKETNVTLKFSVVKKDYYTKDAVPGDPGRTKIGKHASKVEGISVVRAGREIDFGRFDFYDVTNEPTHRWWGCEISFGTELDEAFGVSNNKQHVELIKLNPDDYEDEEVKPIWFQIKGTIEDTIKKMVSRNEIIRRGSRTKSNVTSESEKIINTSEQGNQTPTESERNRRDIPEDDLVKGVTKILEEQGVVEPTDEQIDELLLNKVNIVYQGNNRGPFFDYDSSLGICNLLINIDHPFYKEFLKHLSDASDKTAFELFLASLIRARDELIDDKKKKAFDDVIYEWNHKLNLYIRELLKDQD